MRLMPGVRELGAACQKPRWREVGSLLARSFARPAAVYMTWCALRMRVSPNVVTGAALFVGLGGAVLLGTSPASGFVFGVLVLHAWYLLDHVDGQVARFCRTETVTGVYFDFMMHHIVHAASGFALGYGVAVRTGQLGWALAGAALAIGMTALSLTNDCRYKAYFKTWTEGKDPVASGLGLSAPAAAAVSDYSRTCTIQRSGFGLVRPRLWYVAVGLYRLFLRCCEMPNILLALTGLSVWVLVDSASGLSGVAGYTLAMSVAVPALAIVHLTRQVACARPDREYAVLRRLADRRGLASR